MSESTKRAKAGSRAPSATYRLQLRKGFGFAEAGALAGYLAALGVSHAYLSPILQAAPGSAHGYDVVDHDRVSEELGGEEAFRAMAARLRDHGIGIVVDLVPNHMAMPVPEDLNGALWSVLRDGPDSPYARWFDIDWSVGHLVVPILGAPGDEARPDGDVVRYHEHVFPREGRYRLVYWRDPELNYRRFFDISTLIGLRVEDAEVFERTHAVPLRLLREGLIAGLRIDHPDGLADPRGYLRALAGQRAWVVVEKILAAGEELPADWPCAGTTGYEALGMVGGLFADPAGEQPLTDVYNRLTGGPGDFTEVEREAKRYAAERLLVPEVRRLTALLAGILADEEPDALREVLVELLIAMPVYRAYVVPGEQPPAEALEVVALAAAEARAALPTGELLDRVVPLLLGLGGSDPLRDEFAVRFQQTAAPMTAKGVEDTAFYRWSRLAALNEVGGDPARFAVPPEEFHAHCARAVSEWPQGMTTLSTHDTKRQEDVRARLAVLTELPGEWAAAVARWRSRAPAGPVEADLDYLMWQTIVGAWPLSASRLNAYLTKAMREAKTRTSWIDQDPAYEAAVHAHAGAVLSDPVLTADLEAFCDRIAPYARVNSLGQKLVQLTMPGVPDVYQGCEFAGLSLVDPDNRRPVDYGRRRELLADLDAGSAPSDLDGEKLLVTSRALRLRGLHPDWFSGGYEPLAATGPAAGNALAYRRGGAIVAVTRLPAGLERRGGWGDTVLSLPGGPWRDLLTGRSYGPDIALTGLLAAMPVAVLTEEG
ncbi:malto-oligosyltrehalose synthase [Actinomadura sp. HBU206391]|uniref:malto-oligosyltrehalose synthase n=1 Tax=Actinomadura sp. HBU206391 TaxID=2731692 RepID=UPI0016506990|nr:malto-oligosyltrehalose synthase [Actinomadura sp. HBU206391]MBC6457258.1 malto-oligosyltrehalose synthase [Actinomadura sp. HBU206391]